MRRHHCVAPSIMHLELVAVSPQSVHPGTPQQVELPSLCLARLGPNRHVLFHDCRSRHAHANLHCCGRCCRPNSPEDRLRVHAHGLDRSLAQHQSTWLFVFSCLFSSRSQMNGERRKSGVGPGASGAIKQHGKCNLRVTLAATVLLARPQLQLSTAAACPTITIVIGLARVVGPHCHRTQALNELLCPRASKNLWGEESATHGWTSLRLYIARSPALTIIEPSSTQ